MNYLEAQRFIVFQISGKDMKLIDSHPASGGSSLTLFRKETNTWKLADETDSPLNRLFGSVKRLLQAEKEESAAVSDSAYELGFGELGNGTTVWNRLHEVNGDYETIAHISNDGKVTYYRDDLPANVVQRIENQMRAQSPPASRAEEAPKAESKQPSAFSVDEDDALADVDPAYIRKRLAEAGIINGELVEPDKLDNDSFIRQVMADAERVSGNEPPDLSKQPISRKGDTITIGDGEASREMDIVVSDEDWERIKQAVPETPLQLPYKVGDTVYLEDNKPFIIEKIGIFDIHLSDPSLTYPILRAESKESFARLLERYPQQEKTQPERINYHITDDNLGVGGAKEKFHRNIAAIRLLKQIESENRMATADEQEVLAQYVGWGGLAKAFDDTDISWSGEFEELKSLLDESEYKAARESTLNAHYTQPVVIKAIYKALENMGFSGGNILEPACGVGNFLGLLPPTLSESNLYGVEINSVSGRIAQQLYQREHIQITGFEHTAFQDNFFDVAIGNVPFGAYGVPDKRYDKYNFFIHDYFIAKCLDKVRPVGYRGPYYIERNT